MRILLAPFMLCTAVILFGYSGTLMSFLTVDLPPKQLEEISGYFEAVDQIAIYMYQIFEKDCFFP